MKLFETHVYPKILNSVRNGVNSTSVIFDEVMNKSLFNEQNMQQLCNFINKEIRVGYGTTTCELSKSELFGTRYTFLISWT